MLGQHLKSVDHNFSSRECASVRERELSIQGNAYKTMIKVETPFTSTIFALSLKSSGGGFICSKTVALSDSGQGLNNNHLQGVFCDYDPIK